jgi:hypothetical protein
MRIFFFTGLVVAAVYTSVACSSSDSPSASGGTGGGSGTGGGGGKAGETAGGGVVDGGCVDPTQVFNAVDKCLPKADAISACKTDAQKAQAGTKIDDPTCGAGCTCEQCTTQMFACANDPEGYCAKILTCAQEHNCTGVACYTMANCQTIIDNAPPCDSAGKCDGIQSFSVALVQEVSNCVTKTSTFMGRDGTTCEAACK